MEYRCCKIDKNLTVDGNLEKPEWKKADAVMLADTVTGGRPIRSTELKLLWSSEFLYAAFRCEDDYVYATMTGYNDKLYEEDVVEIFIDDDRDRKTYIEIEVNPLNAVLHYYIQNSPGMEFLQFARVNKAVRSAVLREEGDKAFSVELAIPFTEFVTAKNSPPAKGDRWLMNLYRIDRAKNGAVEYSAWSPTGEAKFHIPQKFGELIFD